MSVEELMAMEEEEEDNEALFQATQAEFEQQQAPAGQAERRQIRSEYRTLIANTEERRQELLQSGSDALLDNLQRANALFSRVKSTSEATLDAKLLVMSADLGLQRSLKLGRQTQSFDNQDFLSRVRRYMRTAPTPPYLFTAGTATASATAADLGASATAPGDRPTRFAVTRSVSSSSGSGNGGTASASDTAALAMNADAGEEVVAVLEGEEEDEIAGIFVEYERWAKLGILGLRYSRAVPAISFLLGPIEIEHKKRSVAARQRHRQQKAELQEAEQVNVDEVQKNAKNESSVFIMKLWQILAERGPMPFWQFVLHPTSFAQTIENMFYTSFLVRDARVSIGPAACTDSDGTQTVMIELPDAVIQAVEAPAEEERARLPKYQYTTDIDMDHWQQLVRLYEVEAPTIPDRGY